jgi:hypothetical protein
MIIRNEDVSSVTTEIPEGHRHIWTTIALKDGTELVFQEATIANLVRSYIAVKTHPTAKRSVLRGIRLEERKSDYAEWQLLEE